MTWQADARCATTNPRAFDTHGGWTTEANWNAVTRWCMFCPVARECAADAIAEQARGVVRAVPLVTVGTVGRMSRPARASVSRIAAGTSTPAREATRTLGALSALRGAPAPGARPGPATGHTARKSTRRSKRVTA